MTKEMRFNRNWNSKLSAVYFTSIRIHGTYAVGDTVKVILTGAWLCDAKVVSVKKFMLNDMNDFMSCIDTGYRVDEAKTELINMYRKFDLNVQPLDFLLLEKVRMPATFTIVG